MRDYRISLMVAIDENYGIGKDDKLLCSLPDDLKRFKQYTTDQVLIMGRKTFESLPKKPLPNRHSIILSRNTNFEYENCYVTDKIEEALSIASDIIKREDKAKELYVIGGAQIYKYFMEHNLVDRLLITRIRASFEADTHFPHIDESWKEVLREEALDNSYRTEFIIYEKS